MNEHGNKQSGDVINNAMVLIIGHVTKKDRIYIIEGGTKKVLPDEGYEHFK